MINFNKTDIVKLKGLIEGKKNIAILTHVNPDGDAIGSSLGLFNFLIALGHKVTAITPNEYPEFLQWLPGNENVIRYSKHKSKSDKILKSADLIFTLDFNHLNRIDKLQSVFSELHAKKIMIDHHPNPEVFADLSFSETTVSSTAELIYLIIKELKLEKNINKNAASCFYTGIMTDTGCFNYNCSNPSTFKTASELIETGIEIDKISNLVYDNYSASRMQLMGYSLNEKMIIYREFNTAIIALTQKELGEYKFKAGDTEGFVNLPLSIMGILFSIFIIEKKDHVKLSFRSKGNFSVNQFAVDHFEGGGHINAAGGQSNLGLNETIIKIEKLLQHYKYQLINAPEE